VGGQGTRYNGVIYTDPALYAANRGSVEVNQAEHGDRPAIRVLVAEDHDLFREGLCLLLAREGLTIVGQADNGIEAVELTASLLPDVVLMDLDLPLLAGIEATRRIAEVSPVTHVLVLTISGHETDVVEALLAGASGYLLKGTSPESLVRGIRATMEGASLMSPGIAAKLLDRVRTTDGRANGDAPLVELLSEREVEVLRLLTEGKQNGEIARDLFLSPHTVRNHISNILAKLQINNRTEATAVAIRAGLV
jgi:DNA-binding NarL/FixJ family response regulator